MNRAEFDAEENEFRRELAPALAQVRAAAGPCPSPDLLMAAVSGVPLDDAEAIRDHAARCPICTQLSRDLAEHELPGASDAEDRRIRAHWQAPPSPRRTPWFSGWVWRLVPAAAILAFLVVGVTVKLRRSPVVATVTPPLPLPQSAGALPIQKAPIRIPAAAVLVFRGNGTDRQDFLKDLAAALEPYRRDDYAESARLLAPLAAKYPDAAEPAFYLGVSQMFLDHNELAIEALESARRHADGALRDDVSWYLALALERARKTEDARRELDALCRRAGEYHDRGCAAASELTPR